MDTDEIAKYFRILGLEPTATLDQVKEAYKLYVQAWHPDKFVDESPTQKAAKEKFIQIDEAKKKLDEFFRENPDGMPKPESKKQKRSTTSDEYVDWQQWENEQQTGFDSAVFDWIQKRAEEELRQKQLAERNKRAGVANAGKSLLITFVFLVWIGRGCTGASINANGGVPPERQAEYEAWKDKWNYELQVHATNWGPVPLSDDEIKRRAGEELEQLKKKWEGENSDAGVGYFLFYALLAGSLFVLFAPPAKKFINNWVESGKTNWTELKDETKAAAEKLASQAKDATLKGASLASDLAEKVKAQIDKDTKPKT